MTSIVAAMSKRKCEPGDRELPSRKSLRLEEKARQEPPSSAQIQKQSLGTEPCPPELPSPSTTDSVRKQVSPQSARPIIAYLPERPHQTPPPANCTTASCTTKSTKDTIGSAAGHKRKHEEEAAQANNRPRRSELAEPPEQTKQLLETAPPTHVPQSLDRPEKDLEVSEGNEGAKALDPVSYWATHNTWPDNFAESGPKTSSNNQRVFGRKLTTMSSENTNKRKSDSTHRAQKLERMAANGVFMKALALTQRSSRNLCESFLLGNRTPLYLPGFSVERISDILNRVSSLNESRIQRDITPWVCPSAENLFFSGELDISYLGDEVQAIWSNCATMGSTRPKPDYTAGLLPRAFTEDESLKLCNYASPERPFFFTPELCFPFLICEAKNGEQGLTKANRQNIHSGSIAVRAIIELYKAAFGKTDPRVKDLYGKILVFTVSHNQELATFYGHYAVAAEIPARELDFYSHAIAMFSLTMYDGADRFKSYNFVYNVYNKFAPEHLKRIKDAAAKLKAPVRKAGPNSTPTVSGSDGESDEQADDATSGTVHTEEEKLLTELVEQLKQESKAREEESKAREEESKEREKEREKESKKRERESKKREKTMERQMEAQRKQMEAQRKQMEAQSKQMEDMHMEMMLLLKQQLK